MANIRKIILLSGISFFCFSVAYGQSAITASGGNAKGNEGSVSYSVGQVSYNAYYSFNGSFTQGVQQPFEISAVTAIKNTENIILEFNIYPNPVQNTITLSVQPFKSWKMRYQLFGINGKLLQDKTIESENTKIPAESLSPAIYFLEVIKDSQKVKTFKIIKN